MKKKEFWLIGSALAVAGLIAVLLLWQPFTGKAERLTQEDAEAIVNDKYPGLITDGKLTDDRYIFTVEREEGVYEILVDAKSGGVHSVKRIADGKTDGEADGKKDNPVLSEEEIKTKLAAEVPGTVLVLEKIENNETPYYKATVKDGEKETIVTINGRTGEIEKSETVKEPDPVKPEDPVKRDEPGKQEEPVKRLTSEQAAAIALKEVKGEIDDVEFKQINGNSYYFVEIETEDDREAVVQIDAITGAVKSLTWED